MARQGWEARDGRAPVYDVRDIFMKNTPLSGIIFMKGKQFWNSTQMFIIINQHRFGCNYSWFRDANYKHKICKYICHYNDVIMSAMVSQNTSVSIVYSTICSGVNQRKHQSSASLAFVMEITCGRYRGPVTRKMFPFYDVIMHIKVLSLYNETWITHVLTNIF